MDVFTLKIGTTTKSLASWGVTGATLSQVSREAESLILTAGTSITGATSPIMAAGDECTLYGDGVAVWRGECVGASPTLDNQSVGIQYTIYGAWYFLELQVYRQQILDSEADPIAPLDPVEWTSDVTLFQDESAERSTTVAQLTDILSQTSRLSVGDLSTMADLDPVGESANSLTLAEALARVLNWHPKGVARVNLDGTLDVIESLTPMSIPLEEVADAISITPRPDLTLRGVVITYRNAYQGAGSPAADVEDTAGATTGEQIARLEYDLEGTSAAPAGVAAHWFSQFEDLQYAVRVSLMDSLEVGTYLGQSLSISGSPWSAIAAPIQRVSFDLLNRTTEIEAGPLPTSSIDDMIELMRLRRYSIATDGARAEVTRDEFEPENPGVAFSSYRITEDTFKISPGYVAGVALGNPSATYSGNGVCWLEVTVDANGGPTAVSASSGSSTPSPTPTKAIIPLHTFSTADGVITVNDGQSGNLAFVSIGTATGHAWF
ncbi:MAG: hypothetical protein ACQKBU_07340 [Verrucomicrobiales bacterium]